MKLLKPDATNDGKLIFNFLSDGEIITIIKEVADYNKTTLIAVKKEAVSEAKTIAKERADKKAKRNNALKALTDAGIKEEEIAV